MSLPNAKTVEGPIEPPAGDFAASRNASSGEGLLAHAAVPALLARAYRARYSGLLVLEPSDAAPSTVRFAGGSVVTADGPWKSSEAEWDVLGRYLPPETLEFAAQHASDYGVAPFLAVERLVLLPRESLDAARQALMALGVRALCTLPENTRFEFRELSDETDAVVEPEVALEPLGLLVECLLVDPHRERAARSIAELGHVQLSAEADNARRVLATLHGPVRAVLESLLLTPGNVQSLRERGLVASDDLEVSVAALLITRLVTLPAPGGSQTLPAVRIGEAPVQNRTESLPPGVARFPSSVPPERRDSEVVRSNRGAKEHAMEQRVEEAWMLAEANPTRAEKIGSVVEKAVSVFPRNPRLRYYLARVHIKADRLKEAVQELEHVLTLDPNDVDAAAELARLRARS